MRLSRNHITEIDSSLINNLYYKEDNECDIKLDKPRIFFIINNNNRKVY